MNNTVQLATNPAGWQQLYQQLQSFYQQGHQQQLTEQAEQLASQLIQEAEQSELVLFSQLQFQPLETSFITTFAVKQACLVLVIARQQCWPTLLQHQLISSVLLSVTAIGTALDAQPVDKRASSMLLRYPARYTLARVKAQLPLYARQWFQQSDGNESGQRLWRRNPFSDLLNLSSQLCRLISLAPAAGLTAALRACYWRCQHPQERQYLSLWAAAGPALWQCGNTVSNEQKDHWLLLEQQADLLLVLPIDGPRLIPTIRSLPKDEQPLQLCNHTQLEHWQWLERIAQSESSDLIQNRLPQHEQQFLAPAKIKQFCQLSLSQQVASLQQEPASCDTLLQAASQQNREQQQVHDVKHALLLLGADQLPWLLAQAQCQRFCQYQAQPHHGLLQQLQQTLQVALRLQSVALPEAQLQLLSWLLTLPLWQLPALRLLPKYSAQSMQVLQQSCLQHIWQSDRYLKRLQLLVPSYGFGQTLSKAIVHFRMPQSADAQTAQTKVLSQQLCHAWQLSCALLFNQQVPGLPVIHKDQLDAMLNEHAVFYPLMDIL